MSVNSVSGYQWNYQGTAATGLNRSTYASAASTVTPHRFEPNDVLNQYLTADDRSTILSTTGMTVRDDGVVLVPVSMGGNEYGAAVDAVGQIAADRANGNLTGPISAEYLRKVMDDFLDRITNNLPEFDS